VGKSDVSVDLIVGWQSERGRDKIRAERLLTVDL